MFKLRIVKVDRYGYNGREHRPAQTDEGLVVTPLKMEAWWNNPEDLYPGEPLIDGDLCADVVKGLDQANHEIMWTCVTDDGRTLELMSHEVRIVASQLEIAEAGGILRFMRDLADMPATPAGSTTDVIRKQAAKLLGRS
jgi:hypothetical protein